jgi:hypothetical protein
MDAFKKKASGGIRTRDPRFTKPLLYQLSYAGEKQVNYNRKKTKQEGRGYKITRLYEIYKTTQTSSTQFISHNS